MQEQAVKGGADRALFVLATLARLERPVSIADLVAETGLPQSTLYRQLALLKRWGFVMDSNNQYSPGPMCLSLAWGFDQSSFLVREAHAELEDLSRASGESIGLLVAVKNQAVCLGMVESHQPLRCSFVKGRGLSLCNGASAKALLAFMDSEHQAITLARLHQEQLLTVDAGARLRQQLVQIRAQGYAISDSEVDAGVWGISAPVFQRNQQAAAVVTLMAPSSRTNNRTKSFIDMTVHAASRISSRLQTL